MTKRRRDAADLVARIEQGVGRGLDLVESFRAALGHGPAGTALAREQRRARIVNGRRQRRHRARSRSYRSQATGGAVVAGGAGAVGLLDAVVGATSGGSAVPGPVWLWLSTAAIGLIVSIHGRRGLRRLGPAPILIEPAAPPPAIARGRVGAAEVSRLTSVRVQVMKIAPALDRLYPGAGDELRRADIEAAGPLTALAERLVVLERMQRDLPGTSAARAAAASSEVVRQRLDEGCATYDLLLATAARLLAAPDLSRTTSDVLAPAVTAMIAYAHGLERAAEV